MNKKLNLYLMGLRYVAGFALALLPSQVSAAYSGQVFAAPEEAVRALSQAVNTTDRAVFAALFGPASETLANPDTVQGAREFADFTAAFNQTNRLVRHTENTMILEVGMNAWPLPIPLRKVENGWQFDTKAGVEELLNRRIGANELDVLRVIRAYVQAQREYASQDRDGNGVLEFAQTLASNPGRTDGLYWPPELNGEISPLGPLVAYAQAEGYSRTGREHGPQPFHGYYFKILTSQRKHAPGGKYDYIINGHMIGGFGLIAWPAEYGETGIMTFMVNQLGRVYQRDFGAITSKAVKKIKSFDPDESWHLSAD